MSDPVRLPQTPAALEALLQRPGLEPETRLLVLGMAAVWPQDEALLAWCIEAARQRGMGRADWEEMLLQAVLFCGFPRAINAFAVLQRHWPGAAAAAADPRGPAQRAADAEALFARIYAGNTAAVQDMLRGHQPSLHGFVMDSAYAGILSRPGLPAATRELMAVGVLALTAQTPQLVAHGRGARRCGAPAAAVAEVLVSILGTGEASASVLRKIDAGL